MNTLRELMNIVEYIDTQPVSQPTPAQERENTELLEAMRRVEELFDY